jgi:glycosyltransferase involved in cell wall biosynthesis
MMATGMPTIATSHSDIPYVFGEHAHMLVPERDAGAIAERLQRYAEDPDTLVIDGIVLRDRIRRAFNVRECAVRLGEDYDAIRRGNGARSVAEVVTASHHGRLQQGSGEP